MKVPEGDAVVSACMTDVAELARIQRFFKPTCVLHAAGVCDLDLCEANPHYAYRINVSGARNIVSVFSDTCYIMYLSADLVFSGNKSFSRGYLETDPPDPVSVVGRTLALAEREIAKAPRHAIIRLGLPMGDSILGNKGAIDFIEGRLRRGLPTSLFHDEYRSCIGCEDLAEGVVSLFFMQVQGLFHLGGPEAISLYEIGERILRRGNYRRDALIRKSRTEDVGGPPRIGNVHLDSGKAERLLGRSFKPWIL